MSRLGSFVTGAPLTGGQGSLRDKLFTVYGPSKRDPSRPDLQAAHADTGISIRQLQRWVRGETKNPNPAVKERLDKAAHQALHTKRGRARAVRQHRTTIPKSQRLYVKGKQGVKSGVGDSHRDRVTYCTLTPAQFASLQDAWADRGSAGVLDWLHTHWDAGYAGGWEFHTITDIYWG